ncbi:MAG: (d)CMP kinase [Salinivirgaceae bacterium]|nr:(d)CMP kinase [Salinivirgaceae bacterium]MDD4745813.1 (d)CMP kinase [Salinivirgaceae bacterium]MDY0281251.1 (d)CMP kinase [Salinivirgaceae bacterium]
MKTLTIAVDGHSSCGKSTLAKAIAKELNLIYIDTGAMYRGATLLAVENNLIQGENIDNNKLMSLLDKTSMEFKNIEGENHLFMNGRNIEREIRTIEISEKVSYVSKVATVRNRLVEWQRAMGKSMNVILDGRDIGTVVFPNADIKFFVTASVEIRAKRRFDELKAKGDDVTLEVVMANIQKRDYIDQNREMSPLKQADDAIVIDNSFNTRSEQLEIAINIIKSKCPHLLH